MGKYLYETIFSGFFLRNMTVLALMTTLSLTASAQTTVTIVNTEFEPIAGATLITPTEEILVSDSLGQISLRVEGSLLVTVSHIAYLPKEIQLKSGSAELIVLTANQVNLGAVRVEGFLENTSLNEQAGGISRIGPMEFQRYAENSLVQAINSVPGVRFEERAGASYRISIRGSSLRSPFGVRNVKVYWNDIPFTDPGGNTFINLLDLANVSDVEIIKGPAASIYGAGNGGVMKLGSTNLSALANATTVSVSTGSFGLLKYSGAYNTLNDKSSLTFKFARQQSDGYRDHNEMRRSVIEMDGLFFPDDKRTITASFLFSDLFYEIPGGLNPEQRAENPRMARPRSEERNASIDNSLFLLKLGQEYRFASGLENKTSISTSFNQFENPFILDYKRDNQQVFALRTEFNKDINLGSTSGSLTFGSEFQRSFFDGKNFGNVAGRADTIRFADEVKARQSTTFLSFGLPLGESVNLNAGISYNTLVYDIDRQIDRIRNNPQRFEKSFDAVWSQRIAVSKQFGTDYSLHLSISNGFSPPTTTEVRTNNGDINEAIQGEKGTNYELNFRGKANDLLSFDLALFHFRLDNAITTLTDRQGVQFFRNAGEVSQNGLEAQLQFNWLRNTNRVFESFTSGISYTYHDFEFRNYLQSGDDFSGNALPGTAPHVFNLRNDLVLKNGLYLNATYHYSDPIPLNDENTFFSRAYNLVNLRAGYKGKFTHDTNFELYFGVDNLFDVSYSLGNDLNAFGRRYFQPAPGINYYLGLKLKLNH